MQKPGINAEIENPHGYRGSKCVHLKLHMYLCIGVGHVLKENGMERNGSTVRQCPARSSQVTNTNYYHHHHYYCFFFFPYFSFYYNSGLMHTSSRCHSPRHAPMASQIEISTVPFAMTASPMESRVDISTVQKATRERRGRQRKSDRATARREKKIFLFSFFGEF